MFRQAQLENILFIDIETASVTHTFGDLPERFQKLWEKKSELIRKRESLELTPGEMFPEKAGIFAEFGKPVCISCGILRFTNGVPGIRLTSYFGEDEKMILRSFAGMLNKFTSEPDKTMCAHNGKEFDFPYLGRRYLINQGDFKSYTSLDLLTAALDIPTPKGELDGSAVGRVFWEERDYVRIKNYCERDVLATAQVMLRFSGMQLITEESVVAV